MAVQGVVPEQVRSNNILEVERCLGVEAARRVVIEELREVMAAYGVDVNIRHFMLLADLMTNRVSFTRDAFYLFETTYCGILTGRYNFLPSLLLLEKGCICLLITGLILTTYLRASSNWRGIMHKFKVSVYGVLAPLLSMNWFGFFLWLKK